MMKEERADTNSQGSTDLSSSAIKLFGQTIAVSGSADSKAASEEVDGASTQLEGENLGSMCTETGSKENGSEEVSVSVTGLTQEEKKEQCSLKKPGKLIPCPRCDSVDTKFCYYNNYNVNQPRHFCKSCQRYWTAGGTLRNVLVGAGRRKNKYGSTSSGSGAATKPESEAVRVDYHESAQTPTSSAFKPLGHPESESVSKLRQSAAGGESEQAKQQQQQPTYVLTPRPAPETQIWTKPAAPAVPVGFFNGAWPYGYNIGLSGAGSSPIVGGAWPGVCVPTFGWNMLQGGWTLPWRPVPAAVGVQMQGQVQQQLPANVAGVSRKRESPSTLTEGERKIPRVAADNPTVVA